MNTVKLISANYTPEDAKDLLMSTIKANINFYNIKNLSSHIRYGVADTEINEKLEALEKAKAELLSMLDEARICNGSLKIESFIRISIEKEATAQQQEICLQAEAY